VPTGRLADRLRWGQHFADEVTLRAGVRLDVIDVRFCELSLQLYITRTEVVACCHQRSTAGLKK
jgi:hypothetical protein